jgi:hypothetical protein
MRIKIMKLNVLAFVVALFLTPFLSFAQNKITCNSEVLRAVHVTIEKENYVLVFLHVKPIKEEYFPPVLSMRLGYKYDNNDEKNIDIMAQKKVSFIIFGNDMDVKAPSYFKIVKDKVKIKESEWVLCFRFKDVPKKGVKKMSMTYGLWDKKTQNERYEQNFVFEVEPYTLDEK